MTPLITRENCMTCSIHHFLCRHSLSYHRWHNHQYHSHAHWGVVSIASLVFGFAMTMLGFAGWDAESPYSQVHAQTTITIDGGRRYQTIEGFGAYMHGSAWYSTPNTSILNRVLDDLVFDLGLTIARFPMPAGSEDPNDNSDPNVLDLSKFDPARIAYRDGTCSGGTNAGGLCRQHSQCPGGTCAQTAGAFDHEANIDMALLVGLRDRGISQFFFEPFMTPAWLNSNNVLGQRSVPPGSVRNLHEYVEWIVGTVMKLGQPPYNINVTHVGVMNEPKYNSYVLVSPNEMIELIRIMRSRFDSLGISAKIMAPSEGRPWDAPDQSWLQQAKGVGLDIFSHHEYCETGHEEGQCADGLDRIGLQATNVSIPVWMSEQSINVASGVADADSLDEGLEVAEAVHEDLVRAGSSAWIFWDALLDGSTSIPVPPSQTPNYAASQRLVFYDSTTVWKSPKYFAMKMYAKAIPPGSVRVGAIGAPTDVKVTAYTHVNGTVTIVALNKSSRQQSVRFSANGINVASLRQYRYSAPCEYGNQTGCFTSQSSVTLGQTIALPPRSVTTFTTVDMGASTPPAPRCGDGVCNGTENAVSCSADCGVGNRAPNKPTLVVCPNGSCPGGGNTSQCGNGQINSGEQCDGANLGGQTCQTKGFQSGTLACASDCTFNTIQCVSAPVCTPNQSCTTNQGCSGTCNASGSACNDNNPNDGCPAVPASGSYPLTAFWQWGGATDPEWYAQFDLVMTRGTNASFIQQVRNYNSNIFWLPARDFNKASEGISGFPEEWMLHDSLGNRIELYGPGDYWVNHSDVAPLYSGVIDGITASNERLASWYARYLKRLVDNAGSDGIATDGLYSRFHLTYNMFSDVDLDSNGKNDLNEPGKGKEWVLTHWENGVNALLQNIRAQLGPNKIILVNTGNDQAPNYNREINGLVFEHTGPEYNWNYSRTERQQLNAGMTQPYVFLNNNHPNGNNVVSPHERDLRSMRFGLGRSMLLGDYFEFTERSGGNDEHYWGRYYDEFDVDLGTPTSDMQLVRSTGSSDQGVWVRFFQNGAVIVNISPSDQVVSNADLSGKTGYAGPYYRFEGGQDRAINGANAMNNGQQFTSVTLRGMPDPDPAGAFSGDAVVLVKTPQKIVSDIIIDTTSMSTSVGSNMAALSGFTPLDCSDANNYYTLRCGWNTGTHSLASAPPGSSTAVFRPNIGISGDYEVFEWHGTLASGSMAKNVTHTITHAGGQTVRVVDQTQNAGRWNTLGTFPFTVGTNSGVTISASGANGTVVADAIRFRYIPASAPASNTSSSGWCGDTTCQAGETIELCPFDCGGAPVPSTGRYLSDVFSASSIVETKGIQYGEAVNERGELQKLYLDLYTPPATDTETRRPAIIFSHGGSFTSGSRSQMASMARRFAQRGYVAATIDYRLTSNKPPFPPPTYAGYMNDGRSDMLASVRFMKKNSAAYKIDTSKIVVGGWSAGATNSFTSLYWKNQPSTNSSNPGYSDNVAAAVPMSSFFDPATDMIAGDPPVVYFLGSDDTENGRQLQAQYVADRAKQVQVPYEYHNIPGAGHSIHSSHETYIVDAATKFLWRHMFAPKTVLGETTPAPISHGILAAITAIIVAAALLCYAILSRFARRFKDAQRR